MTNHHNATGAPIVWALLSASQVWHAVLSVEDGSSVVTYCNGRWPVSEPRVESSTPDRARTCGACDRALGAAPAREDFDGGDTLDQIDTAEVLR